MESVVRVSSPQGDKVTLYPQSTNVPRNPFRHEYPAHTTTLGRKPAQMIK